MSRKPGFEAGCYPLQAREWILTSTPGPINWYLVLLDAKVSSEPGEMDQVPGPINWYLVLLDAKVSSEPGEMDQVHAM